MDLGGHKDIELILLSNAIDFIDSATSLLVGTPSDRDLKYIILHLSAGIELLLKVRLHREHWTLVCDDPRTATRNKLLQGDLNTVGAEGALKRIKGVCGVPIPHRQDDALTGLRNLRNKFEHLGMLDPADALKKELSEVLSFVVDFLAKELKPEDNAPKEMVKALHNIRSRIPSMSQFVTDRRERIKPELEKVSDPILECPSCFEPSWIVGSNEVRCLFCGRRDSDIVEAAETYLFDVAGRFDPSVIADEYPGLVFCVECNEQAVVVGARLKNNKRAFCFNCRRDWAVTEFDFLWGLDNAEKGSVQ